MRRELAVNVGLCGCNTFYDGKLAGQRISIGPATYILTEIKFDDGPDLLRAMAKKPCHFFLDIHDMKNRVITNQTLISRMYKQTNYTVDRFSWADSYITCRKQPISVEEVLEQIKAKLKRLPPARRHNWITTFSDTSTAI